MSISTKHYCKFCGRIGRLTKEHVWPKWLYPSLPKMEQNFHYTKYQGEMPKLGRKHLRGDPHRQTLKIVCSTCNNGWMSRMQVAARPYLEPLARGENIGLTDEACAVLATWATMFAMVSEWDHPESAKVTQSHRTSLMDTGTPPPGWRIWIGRYQDFSNNGCTNHFGMEIGRPADDRGGTVVHYAQTTAFTVGTVFFQTISSDPVLQEIDDVDFSPDTLVHRIFPFLGHSDLRTKIIINYIQFEELSSLVAEQLGYKETMRFRNMSSRS